MKNTAIAAQARYVRKAHRTRPSSSVDCGGRSSQAASGARETDTSCAAGTAEKVAEVIAAIKAGTLHVFDVSTFTVNGEHLTSYEFDSSTMNADYTAVLYQGQKYETIKDGYFHESEFRSAPYFDIRIDGITELTDVQ